MKIRNLNNTSDNPKCPCGAWIKHWEQYTGLNPISCSEINCIDDATDGAHVQKISDDRSWYIVPLCKKHNQMRGQELEIGNHIELVPVVSRDKCKP